MTRPASACPQWRPISYPNVENEERAYLQKVARALARLSGGTSITQDAVERVRAKALESWIPRGEGTQAARVWVSVLCDIVAQGWGVRVSGGRTIVHPPVSRRDDVLAEKARVRSGHLVERDRLLSEDRTRLFVGEMERHRLHNGEWHSVFSLMRDGSELRDALAAARSRGTPDTFLQAIDPFVQVAESGVQCDRTGLDLHDIWRYFRLTWSTVPQSVPGRRVHLLVRDRATPHHAVIGIIALGSPVVQLGVRDKWVGWDAESFLEDLRSNCNQTNAEWLARGLEDAVQELYLTDLVRDGVIARRQLKNPTPAVIAALKAEGKRARELHERFARSGGHKSASVSPEKTDWRAQAETPLFRSKRSLTLAALLEVRVAFNGAGMGEPDAAALGTLLQSGRGRKAIASVLRSVKARHVGIDMADITVCGAVAPYNEVLGGKLVSLLAASPEVAAIYDGKYGEAVSIIASAMKGALVRRRPRLVLLGTTSLYGVGASQYNRLHVPREVLGASANAGIRYEELGKTVGFGSYHFSQVTSEEITALAQRRRGGRRVNSIFGEGVNPKLRRLREALAECGFEPEVLLQHGSPRIVYGVPLATNFRDILLGRSTRVRRLMGSIRPRDGTALIAKFWRQRWLAGRVERSEVMDRLSLHSRAHPVRHGARVALPPNPQELSLFDGT